MTLQVGASRSFFECVVVDDDVTARDLLICRDHCQPCDYPDPFHRHPVGYMVGLIPPRWCEAVMLHVKRFSAALPTLTLIATKSQG